MSTVPAKIEKVGPQGNRGNLTTWKGLRRGDIGEAVDHTSGASIQVGGEFGGIGELQVEASNDGESWSILSTDWGQFLSWRGPRIMASPVNAISVRPIVTNADDTTELTVVMFSPKGK